MLRVLLVLFFTWLSLSGLAQQKVGLVLSGGAAKGIAHIGVLKALEENEIPIDYIVGTSMGGIIGGCYAAGMSPAQIEEVILSADFLNWVRGRTEEGQDYYYFKNEETPSFIRLNLSLDSTFSVLFNTSLANDLSLNFALAEKFAQPSAIANNNFDSLFVPFRVMVSDIFTQSEVTLDHGALSDALRATQTVPLFYNPIRIDGKYLFDGGVYNNFPVDVAQRVFNPDVIIGSNVSSKIYEEYPYDQDDKLISRSLLYMILDKSDPSMVPDSGVYIQPNVTRYTSFDFAKAKALIDSGYVQTIRQMPEIKSKIATRRTCELVAETRNKFNNKTPPFLVDKIMADGYNSNQQNYINRFFKKKGPTLSFSEVKNGFYRLASEDYFNNLHPSFSYDSSKMSFNLKLSRRPQNNFQVDFGGVIATRSISNIFLGLNYFYFNRSLSHFEANFFTGDFYKSAQLKSRIDLPNRGQFYIEPEATFNKWDFFQGNDFVLRNVSPTLLNRIDRKIGLNVGIPVGNRYKFIVNGAYINNRDQYTNNDVLISSDTVDVLYVRGGRAGVGLSSNTLNRKQYASEGKRYSFTLDFFNLDENLEPGTTSTRSESVQFQHDFIRLKISMEQYFLKGVYSTGYVLEGVLSNQDPFSSYKASVINAPAFAPMQDSRTLLLENFRAFNYVAGGIRNVFRIRKNLDFRLEGYVFKPLETIVEGTSQETLLEQNFSDIYFAATTGMVLHSSVGPISLSLNYYDDKETQLGVLLHVGFLLFNKNAME
jgi:NTE family protein